jgi:hypothetical protein
MIAWSRLSISEISSAEIRIIGDSDGGCLSPLSFTMPLRVSIGVYRRSRSKLIEALDPHWRLRAESGLRSAVCSSAIYRFSSFHGFDL